jgi:uncharacterized membrane protein (DUF2068 family)
MGGTSTRAAASAGDAPALRAIVAYKSVRALLELLAALLIAVSWPFGLPEEMTAELAVCLRRHVLHGWAVQLSNVMMGVGRHLPVIVLGLGLDGTLTWFEACALSSARWWGRWIVVASTGLLLPFEVYELLRAPRWSRSLILALNLLIFAYLAQRARAEQQAR